MNQAVLTVATTLCIGRPKWFEDDKIVFSGPYGNSSFAALNFAFPGALSPRTIVIVHVQQIRGEGIGTVDVNILTMHEYVVGGKIVPITTDTMVTFR